MKLHIVSQYLVIYICAVHANITNSMTSYVRIDCVKKYFKIIFNSHTPLALASATKLSTYSERVMESGDGYMTHAQTISPFPTWYNNIRMLLQYVQA